MSQTSVAEWTVLLFADVLKVGLVLWALLIASNYVTQGRFAQIDMRRCAQPPSEDKQVCVDMLDTRTLGIVTLRLPRGDQAL